MKYKRKQFLSDYHIKIKNIKNIIPYNLIKCSNVKTNSWFSIKKYKVNKSKKFNIKLKQSNFTEQMKCIKLKMLLTKKHVTV